MFIDFFFVICLKIVLTGCGGGGFSFFFLRERKPLIFLRDPLTPLPLPDALRGSPFEKFPFTPVVKTEIFPSELAVSAEELMKAGFEWPVGNFSLFRNNVSNNLLN